MEMAVVTLPKKPPSRPRKLPIVQYRGKKEGGQVNQSSLLLKAVVVSQYTGKRKKKSVITTSIVLAIFTSNFIFIPSLKVPVLL